MPQIEMDIHEFLGANYGDLFDPPECNFDLQDSLNNEWLENIFSSSSSSSSSLSPSSSSSTSSSTSAPMTGIDDVLPGSTSPDSVHYEHSYSMGSCDSSPSLDSWHSSTDKGGPLMDHSGDPFEFLRDLCPPIFDLGCDMVEETSTRIKEEEEGGLDLDPRWMHESSSTSSPSSSSCGSEGTAAVERPTTKRNIVLLTDADGQTMTFTSEETNRKRSYNNNNNNNNEELIVVDWSYDDQGEKDPIDLSMYRGKLMPLSTSKKDGSTVIQAATGLTTSSFSSSWQKQESQNAPRSYTLTEALFSNPVPTEGQLLLTDEEKNTLVAEGYPVPTKLPLGKAEEKYLKKIRRKIKNKISAQESRRKKKEYMDHLELKMHKFCQENTELMKKVEHLESNNRQLLVQLRNIQKILKVTGSVSTSGGTSLMVLVLFFAAFIGSWSPIPWSIGYGRLPSVSTMMGYGGGGGDQLSAAAGEARGGGGGATGVQPMPCAPFIGPDLQHPMVDVYSTLSRRSRLLMSTKDEEDAYNDSSISSSLLFGPSIPASYIQTLAYWFSSVTGGKVVEKDVGEQKAEDDVDDWGFTVKHILPLTQLFISKEAPTLLAPNVTFRLPLPNSQPTPPFPMADQPEQRQMER